MKTKRLGVLLLSLFIGVAAGCKSGSSQKSSADNQASKTAEPAKGDSEKSGESGAKEEPADKEGKTNKTDDQFRVEVTNDELRLGGEKICDLDEGTVPEHLKKGGEAGFLIVTLFDELDRMVAARKKKATLEGVEPKTPPLTIITSPQVGYRLLTEVMYSAGHAAISRYVIGIGVPDGDGGLETIRTEHIHAPKLQIGPPKKKEKPEKKPLNLTLAVSAKGVRIGATGAILPELKGCPTPGPTICLDDREVDVASLIEDAKSAFADGNVEKGRAILEKAYNAYDDRRLYNKLAEIKQKYPEETVVKIAADPDIPVRFVMSLIDVASVRLPKDHYESDDAFEKAREKISSETPGMFTRPVLSIVM